MTSYMCGPLNRKGLVCSECADGFGPSVTSFGYTKCIKCDNEWYRVPLFLIYEFVSVTLYISVVYPLFLIFLTWVCIELHGRNFRPLVWLWRPFHRCFVRLRRRWDTKSDIIDVFITFVLLSTTFAAALSF